MAPLSPDLRSSLERAVLAAREEAEKAAEVALKTLAVDKSEPFVTHTAEQRRLRNALRARARQLGGGRLGAGFRSLIEEVAYGQWHRMLFARFLLENDLLMHPTGVAVTLQDCVELAAADGESDPWQLAARYASAMLPGIFLTDDPCVQVHLPPEGRAALEGIIVELAPATFTSGDGLGWVYQFWQTKKKKEVSSSGRKIAGMDLAAYSELFTEDYMVRFLLENSLGAWWAARHPDSPLVKRFSYLRFQDDGTPAAGTFPGWPQRAAEVTAMDPCCGSGHFLVAAFEMLRRMRMEEEGFTEPEAADAVLRDNLFGLEIDPRCVQIAAFALALAAWKAGGYRAIPLPNIACSGIAVNGQLDEWTKLAGKDVNLKYTLEQLHRLFRNAPDLGSLINPTNVPLQDRMFTPDYANVGPTLERALAKERAANDPVAAVFGSAAKGVARAAELLAREYTLLATNVPYLARGKQGDTLKEFIESQHPVAKADLATAFLERWPPPRWKGRWTRWPVLTQGRRTGWPLLPPAADRNVPPSPGGSPSPARCDGSSNLAPEAPGCVFGRPSSGSSPWTPPSFWTEYAHVPYLKWPVLTRPSLAALRGSLTILATIARFCKRISDSGHQGLHAR